ncbi:twin-arginine translocase TatA/TatE family subunit [Myxococcota bacterium]|nr:twin-arginine translocase TatA/TatE family subunit [Myxococcota bacterium]
MTFPLALWSFPGVGELLIILVIILFVFGAPKLPQTAAALGKAIHNFRKAMGGQDAIDVTPPDEIERPAGDSAALQPDDGRARRR